MKKLFMMVALLAMLAGATLPTPVAAVPGDDLHIIPVIVNGYKVRFPDTEPYINTDGRIMVPVRFVSEKLGAEVLWEHDTQTAIVEYEDHSIRLPLDSRTITVNGVEQELDTAAEKYDGRTMVPLRFVSEVLGSEVIWDEDAHSVQIIDEAYQKKIEAGEVRLDPWGREYVDEFYNGWTNLKDMESYGFYDTYTYQSGSKEYIDSIKWPMKMYVDQWSEKIRNYYAAVLNVDYRTIDERKFADTLLRNMKQMSFAQEGNIREEISDYVKWVKENKVITVGYADPEGSHISYDPGNSSPEIYVYFKFKIISAEDTSRIFLDNWNVSNFSETDEHERNVWYGGYAIVSLATNHVYAQYKHYGVASTERMFMKLYTFEGDKPIRIIRYEILK